MQLYLIRHTAPAIEKGICYGQSDIALKDSFEGEWKVIKANLSKGEIVYSSPLSRCLKLADRIRTHLNIPLITDNRLMEMNFGDWEMKNWNDIDQTTLNTWMENYHTVRCPQGECYEDVRDRVRSFLDELKNSGRKSIITVTHAGVIKIADSIINPDPCKNVFEMKVGYGEIFTHRL
jgi:alpha-ribazole phosphatase